MDEMITLTSGRSSQKLWRASGIFQVSVCLPCARQLEKTAFKQLFSIQWTTQYRNPAMQNGLRIQQFEQVLAVRAEIRIDNVHPLQMGFQRIHINVAENCEFHRSAVMPSQNIDW